MPAIVTPGSSIFLLGSHTGAIRCVTEKIKRRKIVFVSRRLVT